MDRKDFLKARIMEGMGKKSGTKPMSDKEKSLAALAHPKDKITHKDVLVGRGVLKKEEVEQIDELSDTTLTNYAQKVHDDSLKHDKDPSKRSAVKQGVAEGKKKQKDDLDDTYNQQGTDDKGRNRKDREDDDDGTYHQRGTHDKGNKKRNKSVMGFSRALNKLESRPVKEEVEQIDEMDKSQPSSSRGAEGLPLGKKAEPIKTDKAKQDALKILLQQIKGKQGVAEGFEKKDMTGQTCEKCKKDKYQERSLNDDRDGTLQCSCGHVVDRWRKYKKKDKKQGVAEEVEQIDELKKGTLMSYVGKAREKNIKDSAKNRLAGTETSLSTIDKQQAKVSKRSKGIQRAYTRLNKEEVELEENYRVMEEGKEIIGTPHEPKGRDNVRAKKMPLPGKVEKIEGNKVYFRHKNGKLYTYYRRMEEEVEQVDEGNKENKAKKNTYVANIIKKKLSSQVLPSLKFGRRELKKEEVEQIDEASWTSATSMHGATRKQNRTNPPTHNIRKGDVVKTSDGKKGTVSFVDGDDIHVTGTNIYYPKKTEKHSASTLKKEEVDLDEAFINGREYASHGLMHPDHAKWQSHRVGVHTDFYAHGTGDKINGQVMKNDGKEVHIKATKSSGGKLHKFKVQSELPK